jgi:hypothetical protein
MSAAELLQIRRAEREALLAKAVALLQADKRVVAAWLCGSLGRQDADDLSDIDLWIVVGDAYSKFVNAARRDFVRNLGTPLLIEEAPQNAPPEGAYLLTLYAGEAGPHQVDWYWQPQARARIPRQDVVVLFDAVGLPSAPPPVTPTAEERAAQLTNEVAFFWAMAKITAKKIARRQSWAALGMLGMVQRSLAGSKSAVDSAAPAVGHTDRRTEAPPITPADQLRALRATAQEMEALLPDLTVLGVAFAADTIPAIYRFFDLAETLLQEP